MEKEYFIKINGENIPVTEEVYRAYMQPVWAESKRRKARQDRELSFEAFTEEGYEIPSGDAPVDEIAADRMLLDTIKAALDRLNDDERCLIDARYYQDKTQSEVALSMGISQPMVSKLIKKILEKLRNMLS